MLSVVSGECEVGRVRRGGGGVLGEEGKTGCVRGTEGRGVGRGKGERGRAGGCKGKLRRVWVSGSGHPSRNHVTASVEIRVNARAPK